MNLAKNQKECRTVTLQSDSQTIIVSDKWGENRDVEWSVNTFSKDSSYHGLSLTYPKTLSNGQRKMEVCISGAKDGEYHGVLLMKEQQVGNSIVQMGIWLKIIVGKKVQTVKTTTNVSNTSKSTATNTTNQSTSSNNMQVQLLVNSNKENTQIKEEKTTSSPTGASVGESNGGISLITIIIIVGILGAFIALFTYRSIKRKRFMEYGY